MIQDIFPHIYDNQYHQTTPSSEDYILYYEENQVLVKDQENIEFLQLKDLGNQEKEVADHCRYLFTVDERKFYLVNRLEIPNGYVLKDQKIFRRAVPGYLAFAGITGAQLNRWYQNRKFCGCCGQPMIHSKKERMMYCPKCNNMEYPKISPAVIVAITDGDRLLLSKYAGRGYKKYALIAGFTEIGETIEETVHREVMEEVGLKVKNLQYYKSQPWSFTDTLLFGFYAQLDGTDTITLDEEELQTAQWFHRDEIPVEPSGDSLTNEMIIHFKNESEKYR
jgi:NAD+ diphosphatase